MACQLGFKIINPARQNGFNNGGVDGFYAGVKARLERSNQMSADLKGRLQLGGHDGRRFIGNDFVDVDALLKRGVQDPVDIVALLVTQAAELKNGCSISKLFHFWLPQSFLSLGCPMRTIAS